MHQDAKIVAGGNVDAEWPAQREAHHQQENQDHERAGEITGNR